jgi:transposase
MRFAPVKSRDQQASGVVFRARDLLVRQRTQIMNGLRGHLAKFGYVALKGVMYVERLVAEIKDPQSQLPPSQASDLLRPRPWSP